MKSLGHFGIFMIRSTVLGLFALASTASSAADQKERSNELIALYMGVAWAQSMAVLMEKCGIPRWQEAHADIAQQMVTFKTDILRLGHSEQAFADALGKAKINAAQEWQTAMPQAQMAICQELSKEAEKSAKAIEKRN